MATRVQSDLNWVIIDPATLDDVSRAKYEAYKDHYRVTKAMKAEFEDSVRARAGLARGKRMVFAYNFGRLSVAIAEDDGKDRSKAPKGAATLADFLKASDALGSRR